MARITRKEVVARNRFVRVPASQCIGMPQRRPPAGPDAVPRPMMSHENGRTCRLATRFSNKTEIWTRIVPQSSKAGGPLPLNLVFSVTLSGKALNSEQIHDPPVAITVLAAPDTLAVLLVDSWSLMLTADTGESFDLIKAGVASRLLPCAGCYEDTITATLDAKQFRVLATSKTVSCRVLSFDCVLDKDDTAALLDLARYLKLIGQ